MIFSLANKRALITGSSRGIGAAIAETLAAAGARIILHCAENTKKAKEIKSRIEENGGTVEGIIKADLTNPDSIENFSTIGEIDILILNASLQYRKKWNEITRQEFLEQVNCNLLSSMLLIQSFAPGMLKQKAGRIVAVGSVQEAKPHPDMLVYSASKAAQTNMVKSLAGIFAADGVTVNSIAPGVILTDRNTGALSDEAYAEQVKSSIPAGFFGESVDCAGMVLFLCTDNAGYITGQNIYIDGGKSL